MMNDRPALALVAALVGIFLSTLVQIGLTKISLSFVDTGRAELIEEYVRRYPDQWLWVHRRWKTRPEGEKPLY